MLLLCPILAHVFRFSVFGDELRRSHIVWFPIKIENFLLRTQKIFRMAMTLETPRHAMRFGDIHRRHMIHRTMATKAADAPIHVRAVIVKNVIYRAMKPYPLDRLAGLPTLSNRF